MKNYSELSDFEINKLVAIYLGVKPRKTISFIGQEKDIYPDYCSNPSDAWPIIIENRIKLSPKLRVKNYNEYYKTWEASLSGRLYFEDNENPLRAAMIVYLAMRGDE